jgi:hypothetical protein
MAEDYIRKVKGAEDNTFMVLDANGEIVPKETKEKLLLEASRLSGLVIDQGNSKPVTDACNTLLGKARASLAKPQLDAEGVLDYFDQVKTILVRAQVSRDSGPRVWKQIAWVIPVYGLMFGVPIAVFHLVPGGTTRMQETIWLFLACGLWGGIGGVVDASIAIYTHLYKQDFDLKYRLWYYIHPFLGAAIGSIILLLLLAGMLALGNNAFNEISSNATISANVTDNTITNNPNNACSIVAAAFPLALAFLAGFKQRSAFDFIGRIVQAIFKSSDQDGSNNSSA